MVPRVLLLLAATLTASTATADPIADRKRCGGGHAPSCEAAGRASLDGDGVAQSDRDALRYFARACDLGRGSACGRAATALAASDDPRTASTASFVLLKGCALGHPPACRALRREAPEPTSAARIARRARKGCEKGSGSDCTVLGVQHMYGDGAGRDLRAANEMFRRACDLNDAWGCGLLASSYRTGRGMRPDPVVAGELQRRACGLNRSECAPLEKASAE